MKCLVVDGYHKGHLVDLPNIVPVLRLPRPITRTICDDYDEAPDIYEVEAGVNDYVLAFKSVDGKMAIYSVDGSSKTLIDNRDFITYENGSRWKDTPVIVGCHDERAVFENSTQ